MCTSILTKAPGEEGVWRESSAAPRDGGEREAPENTKSVRLQSAQELLELLAAAGVDRRPPARATEFHPSSRRQSRRSRPSHDFVA